MRAWLLLFALPLLAQDPFATNLVVGIAESTWKAGHQAEALRLLREGLKKDPHNTRLLSRIHSAALRMGEGALVLETATQLIRMGVDPGTRALPEALRVQAEGLQRVEGQADVVAVLPEAGLLIEGICEGLKGDLLFAAVNKHAILRRDARGKVSTWAVLEGWAPLALALDRSHRRLWVVGGTAEEMEGFDPQKPRGGRVASFDLVTRKRMRTWTLEGDAAHPRVLGDVLLHANGTLYASDGAGGGVWKLSPGGDALVSFIPEGRLPSPQGMAWLAEGQMLLADYALGLFRVDGAGNLEPLRAPELTCLLGLDGLVAYGGSFYATQNGVSPARMWKLDVAGHEVKATSVLRAHPLFGDPTLMTVRPDGLCVVANAQWDRMGAGGHPKGPLDRVVVLRVK